MDGRFRRLSAHTTSRNDSDPNGLPGGHRQTSHTHRKLPHLHGGSLGSLGRGRLISARRPVSGLFRWITGKAGYFSRRWRMVDPDGSPYLPHAGATLVHTDCPAATAGSPTLAGSCRICAAGASAASAGERPRRPAARFLWSHATAGSFSQQGRVALPGSSARCHPLEQTWARRGGRGVPRDSVRGAPPAQRPDTI